jgi:hypothetical protein
MARNLLEWPRRHSLASTSGVLLAAALGAAVWLLRPLLSISPTAKDAVPALAAGVSLLGVLATATVALVGHLLKQSIDLRTARLAGEANDRARTDQRRLQMEAALETVKLLATPQGAPAHPVQASAGLIVLSKLGETALAVDLAAELWPARQMTTTAAVQLCDDALCSLDPPLQRAGAVLILNNWRLLQDEATPGQAQWVSFTAEWPPGLDVQARRLLTVALKRWLAASPTDSPSDFRARLIAASEHIDGDGYRA